MRRHAIKRGASSRRNLVDAGIRLMPESGRVDPHCPPLMAGGYSGHHGQQGWTLTGEIRLIPELVRVNPYCPRNWVDAEIKLMPELGRPSLLAGQAAITGKAAIARKVTALSKHLLAQHHPPPKNKTQTLNPKPQLPTSSTADPDLYNVWNSELRGWVAVTWRCATSLRRASPGAAPGPSI